MKVDKDVKTRRRVEEFLRSSKDDVIIAFGIVLGFVQKFTDEVDVRKIRRKIEDKIRKDDNITKSLAMVIDKLETEADYIPKKNVEKQ